MDLCMKVLKESSKTRFDSYSVRNSVLIISHITFRDCRVHIFLRQPFSKQLYVRGLGQGFAVMRFNFDAVNYIDFAVSLLKHTVKIKCVKLAKKWKFYPSLPFTKLTRLLAHREKKKTRVDAGNDCEALINLFPTKRQIKPQLCIYVFIWCLKICSQIKSLSIYFN